VDKELGTRLISARRFELANWSFLHLFNCKLKRRSCVFIGRVRAVLAEFLANKPLVQVLKPGKERLAPSPLKDERSVHNWSVV
jgi:hypothetical protein